MTEGLSDGQLERYARHVVLEEVGEAGQLRLLKAHVGVVGAGGLGAPVLLYLAAAGVGHLTVIDHDDVDVTNLQRQIIHSTADVGSAKVTSARESLGALNPECTVSVCRAPVESCREALKECDMVVDGSDNFATRLAVNALALELGIPLISGALMGFEGQITTFEPSQGTPCYRCLYPEAPPAGLGCEAVGVLGPVAGLVGSWMATEVLKELLGLGQGLRDRLMLVDALEHTVRWVACAPRAGCEACSGLRQAEPRGKMAEVL